MNFIIQVNEKIVVSELSNIHIVFDSIDNRKQFEVTYVPGDLIISDLVWTKINSDTTSKFFLKFDYYGKSGDVDHLFPVQTDHPKLTSLKLS